MGRWSHLDTDAERLPHGMRRVGYDADTQTYTYADDTAGGAVYHGVPGARYGTLRRANTAPAQLTAGTGRPHRFVADDDPGTLDTGPEGRFQRRLERYKNKTFDDILGPAVADAEEGRAAGLKRWSSISKAAGRFVAARRAERTRDDARLVRAANKGDQYGKVKEEEDSEVGFDEKELPPLPPRWPAQKPRRSNTVARFTRGVRGGVKQMFAEESEFKARRT
ncbi:hypothetical protein B0H67DRAFT_595831 [Lasiosphaeris hirsuta]|uniref:Uncharacterized protein n=1 Tax=Lasiosphaeris hirsuta TaxID=260670 RepID=A0AA40DHS8_9PEZI|nr:hypothetical protein B0H67DRAFT_595831 [Lasiosphaeris hirsuta]